MKKTIYSLALIYIAFFALCIVLSSCKKDEDKDETNNSGTIDCPSSFTDQRDGKTYYATLIGDQCWMAQNLDVGTQINSFNDQQNNGVIEKYCYDNQASNCNSYGGLYQWEELMAYSMKSGKKGICPDGWHIPDSTEWKKLENFCGGEANAGRVLKAKFGWYNGANGTDDYGFSAIPGGYFNDFKGDFDRMEYFGYFWTSKPKDPLLSALQFNFSCFGDYSLTTLSNKADALSVRCIKD